MNKSPLFWAVLGTLWLISAIWTSIEHQFGIPVILYGIEAAVCYIVVAVLLIRSRKKAR